MAVFDYRIFYIANTKQPVKESGEIDKFI